MSSDSDHTVMASAAPYTLTETDRTGIVMIITLSSILIMLLVLATKIILTRHIPTRYLFDQILLVAAVCQVVETSLTVCAVNLGLGQHENTLDHDAVERISQVYMPRPHSYIPFHPCLATLLALYHGLSYLCLFRCSTYRPCLE